MDTTFFSNDHSELSHGTNQNVRHLIGGDETNPPSQPEPNLEKHQTQTKGHSTRYPACGLQGSEVRSCATLKEMRETTTEADT